jgi:hypothetical protein
MLTPGAIAGRLGRGLLAGLIGTAAMTASSMLEMRLRDRPSSTTPAKAAEKVLDIQAETEAAEERLATAVHWGYGTGWGAVRGLLDVVGARGPLASTLHFGAIWPAALVMLPALRVAKPPTEWGSEELAIDAWHHAVYAAATGLAYDLMARQDRREGLAV